jgi:hypothetical protein
MHFRKQGIAHSTRLLTWMLPRCSTEYAGVEDDDKLQFSAGCRAKGTVDWRQLRPPLLDSFREDDLQALAHPPSHSTVSGVLSIDG